VEDDRDYGEHKQDVNERACGVEHDKAAEPRQHQHDPNNQKHLFSPMRGWNYSGLLAFPVRATRSQMAKPSKLLACLQNRKASETPCASPANYLQKS
jgi:hypothetical protein